MLDTTKTLITRLVGTAAVIGATGLTVLACATDGNDATNSAASSAGATASSSDASPSASTDNGIAVVPGPNPNNSGPTSIPAERVVPDVPGTKCGPAQGPDGALELVILKGNVSCDTAKGVAKEYGPLIATGQKQDVKGWTCGPSDAENILAACAKGDDAFVFQLPN
ncbi:hypothetical protein HUN08_01275 [Gordonia sp. X0973]|uniref:hypothetical protein n=1 Tax=Gordonia sp. X0973 TaxID=2742602 RepID=UPI000F547E3C|nr:hypothetical protein [Gordonia sp. X0973]QKT05972.1 hypothetical protein HUN08_01275 [Gordonia sp. X0973]